MSRLKRNGRATRSAGVYGIHVVREWVWWAAWTNVKGTLDCLCRDPDGSGWVRNPGFLLSTISVLLGATFDTDVDPVGFDARVWLIGRSQLSFDRNDALAVNAYHRVKPTYPGIAASEQPAAQAPWWVAELGCPWPPTRGQVTNAFRARSQATHPDRPGGSAAAFDRVRRAHEAGIGWVASREETERG